MAKRTVVDCDICKTKGPIDTQSFSVEYFHGMLMGMPSSEGFRKEVDICPQCMANIIRRALNKMPMEERLPALGLKHIDPRKGK